MSYAAYEKQYQRGKLVKTNAGKGEGNEAYVSFWDLPWAWQKLAMAAWGDPRDMVLENDLEGFLLPDPVAARFFRAHKTPSGAGLSAEKQREKVAGCIVLKGIKTAFEARGFFGGKRAQVWQNVSDAVNHLDPRKHPHKLPANARRLKAKYEAYLQYGMGVLIHRGEGTQNAVKIRPEIADWLVATYAFP